MGWTENNAPSQAGKTAIVTGANSGIGFETARMLAELGAHVVLGCRNEQRGRDALARIEKAVPTASVALELLDLGSLDSVRGFAERVLAQHSRIDILVNNAGIMMPPRQLTVDGFESQLGVNHLGHFALTGRLLPGLLAAAAPRVVSVSSVAHYVGRIDFDDLQSEKRYGKVRAYGQSKLANLLFTFELQRWAERNDLRLQAMAAHPGWTATNLQAEVGWIRWFNPIFAMKPAQGALPSLYGATAEQAAGGEYYGPDGLLEWRGYPAPAHVRPQGRDQAAAKRLWEVSESLTGVRFEASTTPVVRPHAQA